MTTKLRVAMDSTVLLDAIQKTPQWWPDLRPAFRAAVEGRITLLVSEISIAEVCKLSALEANGLSRPEAIRKINLFFQNMFVERRPADRREANLAAELIRDLSLDTCDAIIAATASIHGAVALYTRDGLKVRKKKTSLLECDCKIGDPGLPILVASAAMFNDNPIFKGAHTKDL